MTGHRGCDSLNPKQLLLYAAARCTGHTLLHILERKHTKIRHMEICYSGELDTETLQPESRFKAFHVNYNIECMSEADQRKVAEAVRMTDEKYCGLTQMLRKIAPVEHRTAIVSTEPVGR